MAKSGGSLTQCTAHVSDICSIVCNCPLHRLVSRHDRNRLALKLVAAFYAAMMLALAGIGLTIHWMAGTYGSIASFTRGYAIAAYGATPLFIAGPFGFYPLLWLDMSLGILAVSWAVYLLYTGLPVVMGVPADRGFLYASAVIAVCLVFLMAMMGATVILWDMGFMPEFID